MLSARLARSTWLRRSLIAASSGEEVACGADFTALRSAASFSDWARAPAISLRSAARDFSSASSREASAGSAAAGDLNALVSRSATREASASMTLTLVGGEVVCGAVSPGQPTSQASAITSAAVTAPLNAAASVADEGQWKVNGKVKGKTRAKNRAKDPLGCAPPPWVSPDTSDASSSMVGGERLARPGSGAVCSGLSSSITRFLFGCAPHRVVTRSGTQSTIQQRHYGIFIRRRRDHDLAGPGVAQHRGHRGGNAALRDR